MASYDYNGYVIFEDSDGYYIVDDVEFTSFDEACDWIDEMNEEDAVEDITPVMHTYHIYYASRSTMSGYEEFIEAPDEESAIAKLYQMYPDVMYISDCWQID